MEESNERGSYPSWIVEPQEEEKKKKKICAVNLGKYSTDFEYTLILRPTFKVEADLVLFCAGPI
jgi:hypothetical protein